VLRCVYIDLDGTLLGRGASLLRDGEGAFSLAAVRTLQACHRAEVEVVLFSGRRQAQVAEDARLIGSRAYIFEVGCGLMLDGELRFLTGDLQPGERTIHQQISDRGAPALLLERFAGSLEYHSPFDRDRTVSHLFRGLVDPFEVERALAEAGLDDVRLVDNGVISTPMAGIERAHCYHLIPSTASKARAVATHMLARVYAREETVAVGDSREDMAASEAVGAFWLVANGADRDPGIAEASAARANVRMADAGYGEGVYEAVVTTLAEGR
jgi:hydroxymethylpyrimidine pyrophosphatase-like HAD family hydrolase